MITNSVFKFFEMHPYMTSGLEVAYSSGPAQVIGALAIAILFAQTKKAEKQLKELQQQGEADSAQGRHIARLIEHKHEYMKMFACTMVPFIGTLLLHSIFDVALARFNQNLRAG